ncbi:MAG: DUF952 domain-containing protein [Pseudomonadota bacterium]
MSKNPNIAYKIENKSVWKQDLDKGKYEGSTLDKKDGFIHLSSGLQLERTFLLHFGGQTDLIVAAIDLAQLGETVVWEESRGGELFPHIYGNLPVSAIIETMDIVYDGNGKATIPINIHRHEANPENMS